MNLSSVSASSESTLLELERLGRLFRWEVDTKGLISYASESVETVLGYSPEELVGKIHFYDLFPEDVRESMREAALQYFERGDRFVDVTFPVINNKGRRMWVSTNGAPIRNESGELVGYRGTDRDITETYQIEEQSKAQKTFLDSILETVPVAITVVNANDGLIHFANEAAKQIFGIEESDGGVFSFDDQRWQIETLDGAPIPREELPFSKVLNTGEDVRGYRHAIRSAEGKRKLLEINGSPLRNEFGKIESIVFAVADITEKEAANDAKNRFLANISHELRTPLNGIIGTAQLMQMDADRVEAEILEQINDIARSADQLHSLVESLLTAARAEDRADPCFYRFFDVEAWLLETIQPFDKEARERELHFDLEVDSAIPKKLHGPAEYLARVLNILLENSLRFTEAGGILVECAIASRSNDDVRLKFTVSDSGIGISEEKLAVIFDDFTQGDESLTRNFSGAGIGLSLARKLCERIGAELSAESPINPDQTDDPINGGPGAAFILEITLLLNQRISEGGG